jgi:hypothetical protein
MKNTKEIAANLFRAAKYRKYAMAWGGIKTESGVDAEWMKKVMNVSREECLMHAKYYLGVAKALIRAS